MRTVWKFPVFHTDPVSVPADFRPVFVSHDPNGVLCVWAEVSPDAPRRPVRFAVIGTGQDIPNGAVYRGSVNESPFVWHVYEVTV